MSAPGSGSVWSQPTFCAVCGTTLASLSVLQNHLDRQHGLRAGDFRVAFRIAWRETACAVQEITQPEWGDPDIEAPTEPNIYRSVPA